MSECNVSEDPEDSGSGEEDEDDYDEPGFEQSTPEKRARHAITGRGVTLQMLMADGIINCGEGLLSLEYLGQKFTADLLANGKIKSNETEEIFGSPSSWAIFCKKLVNPAKKSGCGWASVKYKGRKLDSWKTSWFGVVKPRKPSIPGAQSPATSDMGLSNDDCLSETESKMSESFSRVESNASLPGNESNFSILRNDSNMSILSNNSSMSTEPSYVMDGVLDLTTKPKQEEKPAPAETISTDPVPDVCYMGEQEEALNLSLKADPVPAPTPAPVPVMVAVPVPVSTPVSAPVPTASSTTTQGSSQMPVSAPIPIPSPALKQEVKQEVMPEPADFSLKTDRKIVKYHRMPERSSKVDLNMLVECEQFSSVNKIQPYTVSMSTNSLLLMDFHCHLTTSEVVGYLGGKWDPATQHLSIQQAFPCCCRLGDTQTARLVEEGIRANMKHLGMSLVGWYHSHPYCLPEPSIRDIECQMSYQLRMKGARNTYFPCVGIINSPYYGKSLRTESSIQMYMVMPPPDTTQSDYGIPMSLKYSTKQNHTVNEELLGEMKKLTAFYRGDPDWITFEHSWHPGITYLEKLKTSLNNKLPEDQTVSGSFLDFVHHVLTTQSQ